jgi:hypothetical protein
MVVFERNSKTFTERVIHSGCASDTVAAQGRRKKWNGYYAVEA